MFKKALIIALLILQTSNALAKSNLTAAGDITQIALPLSAFGMATYRGDEEGQKEFAKSFVVNLGLTYALKYGLRNTDLDKRPNGGKHSFPSGHSAAAFQGAFFIQKRYGSEYGVPAIALAGFTGYTRVRGDYHHWRDVVGGAALAYGVNHFLVTKYEDQSVSASIDKDKVVLATKIDF
jgi:membrane-associated phospholipid phosphatase